MGIINRFLLFFYTLFFALLSLGIIVLCSGIISINDVWNNLLFLTNHVETVVAAIFIFLISIELMGNCFSTKKEKELGSEGIIVHGEQGDVKISRNAILELSSKLCYNISGVREAKIKTRFIKKVGHDELITYLKIKLIIGQACDAVNIANEIQKNIKHELSIYMGLSDVSIDITVNSISNASIKKKRVV
ncbi:alkaline shock response membrane anchor protein AmaP [Pectinatus sottacetonis]|uniref:alkaline shock response membrane anchor protein AmaP n=1 Tax=Pectinatus sottacetonis TaxID=1002795 RepID=UPI0018C478FA|nr:alkaline shock response membrane anchor protein AmaP [Pectinatus sottacetonis]